MAIRYNRIWAMPSHETFNIEPIRTFVNRYLSESTIQIDPFARNKGVATYTNDLNPETQAMFHLDALDFLRLMKVYGVIADLILFDPPYSLGQIREVYDSVGYLEFFRSSQQSWREERNLIMDVSRRGTVVLSFGWNTMGMGKGRSFAPEEVLIVTHGGGHNDTLCFAERMIGKQASIFDLNETFMGMTQDELATFIHIGIGRSGLDDESVLAGLVSKGILEPVRNGKIIADHKIPLQIFMDWMKWVSARMEAYE